MLTVAQRKRLAREARKLAMECVEGTAPPLARHWYEDGERCAVAWAQERAGLGLEKYVHVHTGEPDWLEACVAVGYARQDLSAVACANDTANVVDRKDAVVFPLLALADALEEAQS